MPSLDTIYRELARLDDVSVDRALAAALPTADTEARRHIVRLLLARRHHEGCAGLILHRHLLDPGLQRQLDPHTLSLSRALRLAVRRRQSHGPANAVQMIGRSLAAPLAYLVTEQLRAGDRELAVTSAACLLRLAQHASTRGGGHMRPALDAAAAAELLAAIEEAVVHYPAHAQRDVLVALCCLLPRPMPRSFAVLGDADHSAVHPMRLLLAEADHPAARRALLWALSVETLKEPALAGLRRCCAEQTLGEPLELAHLLWLAAVRRALQRRSGAEADASLWPDAAQTARMTVPQRRALPHWAVALGGGCDAQAARLMESADAADAVTRLAALRQLLALAREHGGQTLDDCIGRFVSDRDAEVARLAVWYVLRRKGRWMPQTLARLVNSPHESIRRIAAQRLAPIGFDRLWESWPHLSFAQRMACGRALVKIDPHFHRKLGERLANPRRDARLRALSMIGDLQQGVFFVTPLTQLARDADAFIASAAVSALGSAEGEDAVAALHAALDHPDSRVRANAVESLARLESTDHVQQLVRMATGDDNRPRANAIAALMAMSAGEAMAALHRMLDDRRPEHRVSALWLVEQMGVLDVARDVAEMAVSDPHDSTRQRADRVVRELMERMQSSAVAV